MPWRVDTCRSCHARIVWARTAFTGAVMPINMEPVDDGNIIVTENGGGRLIATVLPPGDPRITEETTYVTHFATCPDATGWRRRHGHG